MRSSTGRMEAVAGRNGEDNNGVSVESQSSRRHVMDNGDGSRAGNPIVGCGGTGW